MEKSLATTEKIYYCFSPRKNPDTHNNSMTPTKACRKNPWHPQQQHVDCRSYVISTISASLTVSLVMTAFYSSVWYWQQSLCVFSTTVYMFSSILKTLACFWNCRSLALVFHLQAFAYNPTGPKMHTSAKLIS